MRRREVLSLLGALPVGGLSVAAGEHSVLLGNPADRLKLVVRDSGQPGPLYFAPHDDENIAVRAVERRWQSRPSGVLIELRQTGRRYIYQHLGGRRLWCDPNRMYSEPQVVAAQITALRPKCAVVPPAAASFGPMDLDLAGAHFARIGAQVLATLGEWLGRSYGPLVGVHNNTDGSLNVGNVFKRSEKPVVHRATGADPDDFFLVTEAGDFDALRTLGFNVVLQPVRTADDGSLSVWAARNRVRYFNAEAQHRDCLDYDRARGHLDYQIRMLRALESLL
ncbi:hypothetical protein [Gloeobacter morelensis]|uniref:Uncharacterized protein n=1 Tax=Gloeobacter morelensis MG652769 TaxID=2781736 RepID=A0ABY3PII9_9CYAN|nr:hypothetical protein [Gloeobacter morelensis]UFP93481.1 hypothetical protein ISF26_17015 [Gloeobacter morelensis MG652769]